MRTLILLFFHSACTENGVRSGLASDRLESSLSVDSNNARKLLDVPCRRSSMNWRQPCSHRPIFIRNCHEAREKLRDSRVTLSTFPLAFHNVALVAAWRVFGRDSSSPLVSAGPLGNATGNATVGQSENTTSGPPAVWQFRWMPLPVRLGIGIAVIATQQRRARLHHLAYKIRCIVDVLRELTRSRHIKMPKGVSGSLRERREAFSELQQRKLLLEEEVLPKLAQLYQKGKFEQAMVGGKLVSLCTAVELLELSSSLDARIEASGLLLAEYESIGQPPPPHFRTWPLTKLQQRLADLKSKHSKLHEISKLLAQLGRKRMEWSMPEWSAERLQEHAAWLTGQVEERNQRKQKAQLLGKIEAEYWLRREEVPMSLGALSIPELETFLANLRGS